MGISMELNWDDISKKIDIDGKPVLIPVDFLASEQRYIPRNEFFDITGIHPIAFPGCELGFEVHEKLPLMGVCRMDRIIRP